MIHGNPALACTITGIVALLIIFSTIGTNKSGPSEQFTPIASAPNPCNVTTILSGKHPVKLLPFSSKVIVQKTGKLVFSFAASNAALISYKSIIVSMTIISAPDFSPCTICLLNISYALSKLSVPIGSNISPIGPISRATYFCFPLSTNDAAFLADFIAESITFSNSYPCGNFNSLHPKVSVVATFAPALKYSLCISTNTSGLSNPNASGFCPACSPLP